MATKIQSLYDKASDKVVYPMTHERAVVDSNGTTLETKLGQIGIPNEEDFSVVNGVLSMKSANYSGANYEGYGRIVLRKNVKTEEVVTDITRTPYAVTSGNGYLINLDTHVVGDYTASDNVWKTRTACTTIDVEAGTVLEFRASSMTPAFNSDLYPHWRMWVLADASTGEIIKDDDDEYIMAPANVDYEDSPKLVTIPKAGRLYINCWIGQTSRGHHEVNNVTYTTAQRELNVLENSMFTSPNTIYIVKYDYDINSREITLPKNSILFFDGGSTANSNVAGGAITGNHSTICAVNDNIFSDKVTIKGTWTNEEFYPEWFGAKGDGITDDTAAIQAALNVASSITTPLQVVVKLNGSYVFSDTLVVYPNTTLRGNSVGSHDQNSKGVNTLIAKFTTNLACAIVSSNMKNASYNTGASRGQIDGGTIKYCNSVRIENLRLVDGMVDVEDEDTHITTKRPTFCGIKIVASINSSIRNVRIQGFWYGIVRFATWYASDSNVLVSAYKIGYYAGHDMNNFSIHNGYINASMSSLGFLPTNDEVFNSDHIKQNSAGVYGIYASGTLENVISENADYGRYYYAHCSITDMRPWMEQIKKVGFGVYAGSALTIIQGFYLGSGKYIDSSDSTSVTLVGKAPQGRISIGASDVLNYNTVARNFTQNVVGLSSGIGRYNIRTKQASWWNSSGQFFADANGFGLQDAWGGTYENRPQAPYMRPGAIYMKTESNGVSRPIFQVTEGTKAYLYLTPSTLENTQDGTIVLTVGSTTFTYNYVSSNFTTVAELIDDMVEKAINTGLTAENYRGNFRLYNSAVGVLTSEDYSYDDGDTGLDGFMGYNTGRCGSLPVFVDALGGNAENDRKVSTLPATATDGDILFYTVIGKPVYYSNGHWYDFGDNEVTNNPL